jgi:glycerol-3-phosphate dehydrogenase subunit C
LRTSFDKILDICNGCRLCFNLCGSFPAVFEAAERHGDDLTKATDAEVRQVVDECFQCKVCYERCPYTPDQGHAYELDFPRLMQRSLAQRVRAEGIPLRDRILGDPDLVGRAATGPAAPLVNTLNESAAHRAILDRVLGISPKKRLPAFARKTFASRAKKRRGGAPNGGAQPRRRIVYFATCFVDYNEPRIGEAAMAVFGHNGLDATPATGVCCGMPKWANGDIEGASAHAAENVRQLHERVRAGEAVVVNNPTCSMHMKEEYPRLAPSAEAREVAGAVKDLGEFLRDLDKSGALKREFARPLGKVAYHVPCHLRAQKIGQPMQQILTRAGAEVEPVRACSGHDGTWSMKSENFEGSMKWGAACFRGMEAHGGGDCASDCPLAAIQIRQATGLDVRHPIELLARAYGLDVK